MTNSEQGLKSKTTGFWHRLREHLTTWAIGGILIGLTGFTPEEWLAKLFEATHLPPFGFDIRVILVLAGVSLVAGNAIYRSYRQTVTHEIEPSMAEKSALAKSTGDPTPPFQAIPNNTPSVAVLPFTNMSGDPDQQYFSDGITEDIITELSRFRSLFVVARNSSFHYRDKADDVRTVAKELGVRYIVEGSVRKIADRIRITAQLIDAIPGNHLWSEKFDRNLNDLFAVQDEVTQTIVATLTGQLEDVAIKKAASSRASSLPAYDCLLRGIELMRSYGGDVNRRAREFFEKAIVLDPQFAVAHSYLALSLIVEHGYGSASKVIKDRALESALKAVKLDPRESRCFLLLGQVYRFRGEFDSAVKQMEQSIKLNPNDANGIAQFGSVLAVAGRAEEGVGLIKRAMILNPFHPDWYWRGLAIAYYAARKYDAALDANYHTDNGDAWSMARIAACLVRLGRIDEARVTAAEVLRLKPDFHLLSELPPYKFQADADHLLEGMRLAGLPD